MSELVSGGFSVVATDYEGLGTPGVRPYQVPYSEGRSMIDAVLAARQAYPQLSTRWFAAGHSSGGHAALETAEVVAAGYARGTECLGVVALEPAGDLSFMAEENPFQANMTDQVKSGMEAIFGDWSDPMHGPRGRTSFLSTLAGWKAYEPELALTDYLGPLALERWHDMYTACNMATVEIFGDLPKAEFGPRSVAAQANFQAWMHAVAVPRRRTDLPVLFAIGDRQADLPMIARTYQRSLELGNATTLKRYPDVDHRGLLAAAAADMLGWMRDQLLDVTSVGYDRR
jgi:pimeloyl-ACP methyl ester carboxylesterase